MITVEKTPLQILWIWWVVSMVTNGPFIGCNIFLLAMEWREDNSCMARAANQTYENLWLFITVDLWAKLALVLVLLLLGMVGVCLKHAMEKVNNIVNVTGVFYFFHGLALLGWLMFGIYIFDTAILDSKKCDNSQYFSTSYMWLYSGFGVVTRIIDLIICWLRTNELYLKQLIRQQQFYEQHQNPYQPHPPNVGSERRLNY